MLIVNFYYLTLLMTGWATKLSKITRLKLAGEIRGPWDSGSGAITGPI